MNRKTGISRIKQLLSAVEEYDRAREAYGPAKEERDRAGKARPSHLKSFDEEHKEAFLEKELGKKPKKPLLIKAMLWPLYASLKKEYEQKKAVYEEAYPKALARYEKLYEKERESLRTLDKEEYGEAVERAESAYRAVHHRLRLAKQALDEDDLLSDEMKNKEVLKSLLRILEDRRADTMKEAVNLWYEEQRRDEEAKREEAYRKKCLELEEERVRAAQAFEEYAKRQAEDTTGESKEEINGLSEG